MERRGLIKAAAAVAGAALVPAAQANRRGHDFYFTRLAYESGDWEAAPRLAPNVLRALRSTSTMRIDPAERVVAVGDARMLAAPFCYLGGSRLVQFNPAERRNFERYVRGGGFVLVNGCTGQSGALFGRSFEADMARLFGPAALQPLPAQSVDALYSSFFRLAAPPPGPQRDLRAIVLDGRVRVLYSNRDHACEWDAGAADSLRLAVNIIHYALGA